MDVHMPLRRRRIDEVDEFNLVIVLNADKTQRPVDIRHTCVVAVRLRSSVDLMRPVQTDGVDVEIGHHLKVFDHDADMVPVFDLDV
jgi:hypothetical protein